jgi:hypothetical protein
MRDDHQDDKNHQTQRCENAHRFTDLAVMVVSRSDGQDSRRHHRGEHIV